MCIARVKRCVVSRLWVFFCIVSFVHIFYFLFLDVHNEALRLTTINYAFHIDLLASSDFYSLIGAVQYV